LYSSPDTFKVMAGLTRGKDEKRVKFLYREPELKRHLGDEDANAFPNIRKRSVKGGPVAGSCKAE